MSMTHAPDAAIASRYLPWPGPDRGRRKRSICLLPCALWLAAALAAPSGATTADDPAQELAAEVEAARLDFQRGTLDRAARTLTEILDENPDYDAARVLLLRVSLEVGDIDRAEQLDQQLALRSADTVGVELLLARGDYAFARGRTDLAVEQARAAVELAPRNLHGHFQLARAFRERGERQAARDVVERAAQIHVPKTLDADGLLDLARLYQVGGASDDLERAAQCCVYAEKARQKEGRPTADVLVLLGELYFAAKSMTGSTPRAFATYRDALAQNGVSVAAKVGRAWTHLYVYDSFDAEKEIEEALAINPRSVDALTVKAWIRVMDARHSEALELLDAALSVNPAAKKARAVRAAALYMLRREAEFTAECEQVLRLDPTYGELYWTVGDALSHLMRFGDAVDFHRRALALDPDLPLALVSLGRDLGYVGEEGAAREALERSLDTHPFPHPWRHNMLLLMKKFDAEFLDLDAPHFTLRMHVDENAILGPRLWTALEDDLAYLEQRYGWKPPADVLVETFPDHEDFSVRSVGMIGLSAVGACFGGLVTLVSPRADAMRRGFVWRRTALHELTHVMTLGRSKGRVPRWLTEGLSVFEERCARKTWGRDQELELLNAWYNDDIIPLETFNAAFRGPRVMFGYYQGGLFCEFVTERYGFDRILAMLDAYADDLELAQVTERVFDKSPAQLDAEFNDYLFATYLKDARVQPVFGEAKRRSLRNELRKRPADVDVLSKVAWAYYQAGKEVDADVHLDQALRLKPDFPPARRLAAQRAFDRRRPDLAREHLAVAFANGGEEYFAALLLARIRAKDKDFAGATEALELARRCCAFDVGPANPDLAMRELLAGEGDMDGAMAALKRYVDRQENEFKGRLELATWYLNRDDAQDAARYASEAAEIDPFDRAVFLLEGRALRKAGQLAAAIAALRCALQVDPRLEAGYSPPPTEDLRAQGATEDRMDRAEVLAEIAEIEFEAGDRDAARRDMEEALRMVPDLEMALDLKRRLDG